MAYIFKGTIEELQDLVAKAQLEGSWQSDPSGKHTFRTRAGGVLNWWPSRSTVQIQGPAAAKPAIEWLFQSEQERVKAEPVDAPQEIRPSGYENRSEILSTDSSAAQQTVTPVLGNRYKDSELVIGLVGAVGTDTQLVERILIDRLKTFGYEVHEIRVSRDVIPKIVEITTQPTDEYSRISQMMDFGDEARESAADNSILASGVAAQIAVVRAGTPLPRRRMAYLVVSLKTPEEVRRLREIYPEAFYLVGVHADEIRRLTFLTEGKRVPHEQALSLMKRDADEHTNHGQRLSDTFHMSDFFVRIDGREDRLRNSLWRILDVLFGDPFRTPTFDEYAMFLAFSASLRSADLSRQVGAVVAKNREILATGSNDCPRRKGGLYWAEMNEDSDKIEDEDRGRDYMRGYDSNKDEQAKMIEEIISDAGNELLDIDALRRVLARSRIKDLTEFGRVVHAEMEALLACARNQGSARSATIYCTTFPCHNCAKHIIAAGVARVVFVEPYEKSKAAQFHDDAIVIGFQKPETSPTNKAEKVRFEPFVGVGPRRFFDLFSMKLGLGYPQHRHDGTGKVEKWRQEGATLRVQMLPYSYLELEKEAARAFRSACQ